MYKILVFAGTTEGRKIAEFLDRQEISAHICVATQYGETLLPKNGSLHITHDRFDKTEMEVLMEQEGTELVLDATHPYAAEVTKNIRQACEKRGCRYVRMLRENIDSGIIGDCVYVDSLEDAVKYLNTTSGNILATTGSKELAAYTKLEGYTERVFARVLSLKEVAASCAALGFEGKNLICMQGPFSAELNEAMLRQLNCRYLVTKMSGSTGGYQEKIQAAYACGCTPVVIGRPLEEFGLSFLECKRLLCKEYSLHPRQKIALVGIGMGGPESRTLEAKKAIANAEVIIGAGRMVRAAAGAGQDVYEEYDGDKIAGYLRNHPEYEKAVVVLSGDVGFYSGAKKLLEKLDGEVHLVCGISSVVYFMSKIQKPWEDVKLASAHGKDTNLISLIRRYGKVFSILGSGKAVSRLAEKLVEYHMENVRLFVGEQLSYKEERILSGGPKEFLSYEGNSLGVLYAELEGYELPFVTHGHRDEEFIRDKVPMTKEEVRTVSLSKLRLTEESVCYDIGAGTGSVAVEMALLAGAGRVYAIEKKSLAVELLRKNKQQFAADNLEIVEGEAPEALADLERPTHAFIGGSSGNMMEIMRLLLKKNPNVRIVINCIALESIAEALRCIKELPVTDTEMVQLSVGKSKEVGNYHMMMGENPIMIISCEGKGEDL